MPSHRIRPEPVAAPADGPGPGSAPPAGSSAERPQALLSAARRAFAEKGFDGASMQDLARAAGMSAGNFYRYFRSRDEILSAMVEQELADIGAQIQGVLDSDQPAEALRAMLLHGLEEHGSKGHGLLWAEIEVVAARRPEIAAIASAMEAQVVAQLLAVFARVSGLTRDEAARRCTGHARYLLFLYKGACRAFCTCDRPSNHGGLHEARGLILGAIDRTLAEIAVPPPTAGPPGRPPGRPPGGDPAA